MYFRKDILKGADGDEGGTVQKAPEKCEYDK
jgi:hypothetical protein